MELESEAEEKRHHNAGLSSSPSSTVGAQGASLKAASDNRRIIELEKKIEEQSI